MVLGRNQPCWCGSGKKYKKCHLRSDEQADRQATAAPRDPMVKTPREIAAMRRACTFNGELMDHVRPFVKVGTTTHEIDRLVHDYTVRHGHRPACLGYHGFPKSVCTSVNEVVCHGIPSPKVVLQEGDIVNIDLTTVVDGFFGDSSETFLIGAVSNEVRRLVQVTARALLSGIGAVGPGVHLSEVAEVIEPYVKSQNCSVVKDYTGHGIGKAFHEHFSVCHHIGPECDDIVMRPGMTFTIEPMVNLGGWQVVLDKGDHWTVRTRDGSLSAQFEHTVLVTETGYEVLTLTPAQKQAGKTLLVDGVVV